MTDCRPGAPTPRFLTLPPTPHPRVRWAFTLREGGVSQGPWGGPGGRDGLNLGARCGDEPGAVVSNRAALADRIGRPIRWLDQVHGVDVSDTDAVGVPHADGATSGSTAVGTTTPSAAERRADAQVATRAGAALAILVADCLPVLLADREAGVIGAAHAGWRGLAGGVVDATVAVMRQKVPRAAIVAWLGPSIGPTAFEVGDEVRSAFVAHDPDDRSAFAPGVRAGKWWADLPALASNRLRRLDVEVVGADQRDAGFCTVADDTRFWSFRRDRVCGRMAALVWLDES